MSANGDLLFWTQEDVRDVILEMAEAYFDGDFDEDTEVAFSAVREAEGVRVTAHSPLDSEESMSFFIVPVYMGDG